jgi:ParB family chromosome partitioning protein
LDGTCYQTKLTAHIDRAVAARPDLIQIENGWRNPREQRVGAIQRGRFREIETVIDNPDAEPVFPCEAAKPAIIVYGKRVGTTITVCTDDHCPVHDPRIAAARTANPAPQMPPAPEAETEAEAEERKHIYEQQRQKYQQERERLAEANRIEEERRETELEAERARREKLQHARQACFERILSHAPAMFSAAQLRVFLHALISLDPYTFIDEVAEHFAPEDENGDSTSEGVLTTAVDALPDDKLTGFALRLVLTGKLSIPSEGEVDLLVEAEAAFMPTKTKKAASSKAKETPSIKAEKPRSKKATGKKQVAA